MEIQIKTSEREELIDITNKVKDIVKKNSDKEGNNNACIVYVPHATCSIIVNENYDNAVCDDILNYLNKQIPQGKCKHDKIDNNADAHIKASIIGPGQIIPIDSKTGDLQLGTWQGIALAEFDGPRKRTVVVRLL